MEKAKLATSKDEKVFQIASHVVLMILAVCAILPFVLLVVSSLTDEKTIMANGYSFFPKKWSFDAYAYLLGGSVAGIVRAYGITILVTAVGTGISLLIGPMLAYAMSRRDYPRRRAVTMFVLFTMLFNGGLVPTYLLWTGTFGIKNSLLAYIFPALLVNAFNIILMKSYFASNIHPALIEAAKIDGAGEFTIYFKIVLPLSLPILATMGLMIGISYWNDWTNGLYYINKTDLYSLQHLLNKILTNIKAISSMSSSVTVATDLPSSSVRMAMAVIGIVPIMALYPFFQKYFVKGINLGGVKE